MRKLHKILIIIAVYSLLLGIRIYWLSQKEGFHLDEGLTITLSCYNEYMVTKNFNHYIEYEGKEIKEMSLCSDNSISDVFKDICRLWKDNRDPPHTNLYYSFLRLSFAGLKTGEIKPIIFRGGLLNLIFFTVSFFFFFKLIKYLFSDSFFLQITSVACSFLSTAAISNTLFLRPYQIQETVFIIFCFYLIKSLNNNCLIKETVNKNERIIIVKQLLFLSFITGITLLTGYYVLFFICLFGLYIVYLSINEKEYKKLIFYFSVLILGILIANILYQKYFDGYFSYRAQEVNRIVFFNIFENIKHSLISFLKLLNMHFYSFPVLAILCISSLFIIFYKQKIIIQKTPLMMFLISIVYSIIVMIVAPYKILRYIMPVFPFLILLPAMIIDNLNKKSKKIAYTAMLLLCLIFVINSMNVKKIEHTYKDKAEQYIFTENTEIPVVILNYSLWKYPNLIPYLNDKQIYVFIENYNDIYSIEYPEFYLIIEDFPELRQAVCSIVGELQLADTSSYIGAEGDYIDGYKIEYEFEINGLEPETFVHNLDKYFYGMRISRCSSE